MKGPWRPPLDSRDTVADNRTFSVSVDWDAAQIVLQGLPIGAGGGASLVPVPGIEMVFDRADARLSQVIVDAGEPGGPVVPSGLAVAYIGRVLGRRLAAGIQRAPHGAVPRIALRAQPGAAVTLSRLARLDAARLTSPVPSSRLWAEEAAQLAWEAGLTERARMEAHRARTDVPPDPDVVRGGAPNEGVVPTLAGQVPDAEPGQASRRLGGWLDPALVPAGVFRHGLFPESDLIIRTRGSGKMLIAVETMLAATAGRDTLARCRVRLVDSDARLVLAVSPFCPDGQRARAELDAPARLSAPGTYWVEAVDDERRPVQGTRMRRMRSALRWADAALRAESRPAGLALGLADEQWTNLAALAWERCRADWEAATDADRAYLAASRGAALAAGTNAARKRVPEPPSSWAAQLAQQPVHRLSPFLAEEGRKPTCDRATGR